VDAATRVRALIERGATVDEVIGQLRTEGFSLIESIAALVKETELTLSEAKTAVVDSATWADQRDRLHTRRLIRPPELPDDSTIERLRGACSKEPRILEAWVIGNEMTTADGSSRKTTGVGFVFDPSFPDTSDDVKADLIAKLDAAAPEAAIGSWLFRTWRFDADEAKLSLQVYSRFQSPG
jgi:hypothetical protein